MNRPEVTGEMILAGLRRVGVEPGSIVLAHSSLRSFGWVHGGEDAVIDALVSAVGPAGTVCMPTVTYGDYGPRRPPPPFDPRTTPGIAGRIPECLRCRPNVVRSVHPTHSLCAVGARAEELVRDHDRSPTPCGRDSPWGRVAAAGGLVLMLGVGTKYCTLFHGPEEEAEPDVRCTRPVPCVLVTEAGERTVLLRLHRPYRGAVSRRSALAGRLEHDGLLQRTSVGAATLMAIDAGGLWDVSLGLLRARPARVVDKLEARARHHVKRALRAMTT